MEYFSEMFQLDVHRTLFKRYHLFRNVQRTFRSNVPIMFAEWIVPVTFTQPRKNIFLNVHSEIQFSECSKLINKIVAHQASPEKKGCKALLCILISSHSCCDLLIQVLFLREFLYCCVLTGSVFDTKAR